MAKRCAQKSLSSRANVDRDYKNMFPNQMTCVWDSLLKALRQGDVETILGRNASKGPLAFVRALKASNIYTAGVRWQGVPVGEAQLRENMLWIGAYDEGAICGGHLTSSADPFFMLICYLFHVRIHHIRPGCTIEYMPATRPRYTLRLLSRTGHMTMA
jgi:hypothetical protein